MQGSRNGWYFGPGERRGEERREKCLYVPRLQDTKSDKDTFWVFYIKEKRKKEKKEKKKKGGFVTILLFLLL